jgi:hypothetical protein
MDFKHKQKKIVFLNSCHDTATIYTAQQSSKKERKKRREEKSAVLAVTTTPTTTQKTTLLVAYIHTHTPGYY